MESTPHPDGRAVGVGEKGGKLAPIPDSRFPIPWVGLQPDVRSESG